MNIRTKLKILNIVTVLGLALVLLVTIYGLNTLQERSDAANRRLSYVGFLIEFKASALSTIMLDPTSKETKEVFAEAERNVEANVAQSLAVIRRQEVKDQLEKLLGQWRQYDQESQALITLAQTDVKAANDKLVPLYNERFKPLQTALEAFIAARQAEAAQSLSEAKSVSRTTFWEIVTLLALVGALNVGMGIMLAMSLQSALEGILEKLTPLRQGNLTTRLPVAGKDELSDIARGVNAFVEELQAIVQRTFDRAHLLSASAQQLAGASEGVLRNTAEQSSATASVAAVVEEFSVSIDQVADNATQAEQKSTQSGELAQRGAADVAVTVEAIRNIEKVVSEASDYMVGLGQKAQAISGIVNVIKDVADQTNLLALNAAIEAARAGESGRGFAVVADEVRKLAERTASSAQEITGMVQAIQQSSDTVSEVMQKGSEMVAHGVTQTAGAGQSMTQINTSSASVIADISDISAALREQRLAGTEIAQNIERIAQMTEHSRLSAEEVSAAAGKLNVLASELREEVNRFQV